ncbi:MAG: hypothetical protein IJ517_03790 [Alphaproteobacteria bacterium]|nr:hypothetical protein [Alphaproteobacteria bacterium]
MNNWLDGIIEETVQCWGCAVFDRLFQIVSDAAGSVYSQFSFFCTVLFCVLFAFYVLNAVWKNIKGDASDPFYKKSVQRVFINAIVCIGFLGMGVALPRFISTVTFEPAAQIAMTYTQAMINLDSEQVAQKVTYQPMEMPDDGFYRPELRDKIILLMKTTITQFQSYIKLGVAIMETAFTWDALLGIGALIKHIILFVIGAYLAWYFFKMFFRFCCYFADIIIAMVYFAFFFPLSIVLFAFKGADNVPSWVGGLGKSVGISQFKNLINAIITLASAVITYTVIMVIIAKFFADPDVSNAELMNAITTGKIFDAELNTENLMALTLGSCVVLTYVLNYIYGQIPQVTKMILSAFGVSEEKANSEALANDMMTLTKNIWETTKKVGATIISGGQDKDKEDTEDKDK